MNNESLQDWLEKEEARRLALKVVRKKLDGPTVSWISKDSSRKMVTEIGENGEEQAEKVDKGKGREVSAAEEDSTLVTPQPNATAGPSRVSARISGEAAPPLGSSPRMPSDDRHTRNFVLLEPAPANWYKEMRVLFGNHTNWSKLKVVPARNRPQSELLDREFVSSLDAFLILLSLLPFPARRPTLCAITGLPALYLDPRTGVPYANLSAYKTLTSLLEQQWNWSAEVGAYVGGGGVQGADGLPEGWDGKEQDETDREDATVQRREARVREGREKAALAAEAAAAAVVEDEVMLGVEEQAALPVLSEEEEMLIMEPVVAAEKPVPKKRKRARGGGGGGHGGKRIKGMTAAAAAALGSSRLPSSS